MGAELHVQDHAPTRFPLPRYSGDQALKMEAAWIPESLYGGPHPGQRRICIQLFMKRNELCVKSLRFKTLSSIAD